MLGGLLQLLGGLLLLQLLGGPLLLLLLGGLLLGCLRSHTLAGARLPARLAFVHPLWPQVPIPMHFWLHKSPVFLKLFNEKKAGLKKDPPRNRRCSDMSQSQTLWGALRCIFGMLGEGKKEHPTSTYNQNYHESKLRDNYCRDSQFAFTGSKTTTPYHPLWN